MGIDLAHGKEKEKTTVSGSICSRVEGLLRVAAVRSIESGVCRESGHAVENAGDRKHGSPMPP